MYRYRMLPVLCAAVLALLAACQRSDDTTTVKQSASPPQAAAVVETSLFHRPLPLQRVELVPQALAVWRQFADRKPTLLLVSDIPMLSPAPPQLRERIDTLAQGGTPQELSRYSYPKSPELLIHPDMTVDTALRLGWLGELVWALPLPDSGAGLTLEPFRKQLLARDLVTAQEADSLSDDGRQIRGRLRNTPFRAGVFQQLEPFPGPLLVHFDLSYFKRLYKNDIATPLLEIVIQTLGDLREQQLHVLAVTFSYGNLDERIALDVRFLGDFVALLTEQPDSFEKPLPVNFGRQAEILYLANFFQKEKIRDLALAQEKELPAVPWVQFNLFRSAAEHKDGVLALDYLAKAVSLDRAYAVEYPELARYAYEKGRPEEARRMLELAANAIPEDPQIRLQLAQLTAETGDLKTARRMVEQLRQLPWQPVYFAVFQDYLAAFSAHLVGKGSAPASPEHLFPVPSGTSHP